MLGRLARYLRFVGHDTVYLKDRSDAEIIRYVRAEGRRLITRDRALARRTPDSLLLESPHIADQFRDVVRSVPSAPFVVTFVRCTLCNGLLEPLPAEQATPGLAPRNRALWRCRDCEHVYWEGSHTDRIRTQVAEWVAKSLS
jgi:uncharacterized protein with PIN domain